MWKEAPTSDDADEANSDHLAGGDPAHPRRLSLPDPQCLGHQRTYRSPEADALALPGFTFGLDIVLLVGQLHLGKHQTVDEIHQATARNS